MPRPRPEPSAHIRRGTDQAWRDSTGPPRAKEGVIPSYGRPTGSPTGARARQKSVARNETASSPRATAKPSEAFLPGTVTHGARARMKIAARDDSPAAWTFSKTKPSSLPTQRMRTSGAVYHEGAGRRRRLQARFIASDARHF